MKIFVLNGPSLNLLGQREPDVYGHQTLEEVEHLCVLAGAEAGLEIEFSQTNEEGELVNFIHAAGKQADGIIINPAAFSHYSLAVRDALAAVGLPVVEVHISNIYAREDWRAKSVVSGVARGVIAGLGVHGYVLAIEAMATLAAAKKEGP